LWHPIAQRGFATKSKRLRLFYRAVLGTAVFALWGVFSSAAFAQNPVPFINQPLVPDATAPGGEPFTLTVNGTGFVSGSAVNWNGSALDTQFINASQLKATVPAADIATASTASVTVVNPAPGSGASNVAFFTVAASTPGTVLFRLTSSVATDFGPSGSVALGDFNGDGNLDLAVAVPNYVDSVYILLGDGTGNFGLASSPYVGYPANGSLAVGDFNGDGKLDLAVGTTGGISILLGDGRGNFTLASSPVTDLYHPSLAVGDFNGDGKLDLAVPKNNTVSILLGDGTGNFTLASSPAVGNNPVSVAVGDFNEDGKLDLAVANENDNTVSILLGDGTGSFTLASSPAVGNYPASVAVGDFNGDGKLDLVTTGSAISVLMGDGAGNITLASSPADGDYPASVAVGDFNGDGRLDLAVANYSDGLSEETVSILLQIPTITFNSASVSFGGQLVSTSLCCQIVTLTNPGDTPVGITSIVASGDFGQTNTCGALVAPGASCTISITFTLRATSRSSRSSRAR
jgi:hypothetical protein